MMSQAVSRWRRGIDLMGADSNAVGQARHLPLSQPCTGNIDCKPFLYCGYGALRDFFRGSSATIGRTGDALFLTQCTLQQLQ